MLQNSTKFVPMSNEIKNIKNSVLTQANKVIKGAKFTELKKVANYKQPIMLVYSHALYGIYISIHGTERTFCLYENEFYLLS